MVLPKQRSFDIMDLDVGKVVCRICQIIFDPFQDGNGRRQS
jgi:hypothetical protein